MIRTLQAELVDDLPAHHPAAIETRRDLRRINTLMGHAGIFVRALKKAFPKQPPKRLLEIGAGDGEILLRVARRLAAHWRDMDVTFVDLQSLLTEKTKSDFAALHWKVRSVEGDILNLWAIDTAAEKTDAIQANLVLHHFTDAQLTSLLSSAAKRTDVFIAVEPRREGWSLFWANSLALIGCGPVACHDAPISVQAGFTGRELSALWPQDGTWLLTERRAGLFSHLFIARRKS